MSLSTPALTWGVEAVAPSAVNLSNDRPPFPPPWTVERLPGGFKVIDANGQSLAYVYSRENPNDAHMAKVLTEDWRVA